MNKKEAKQIILSELESFRSKPHTDLITMIDAEPVTGQRVGQSGTTYQIEIQVFWDGNPGGNVRVVGSVDDGGWRAFVPLTETFIKTPTNECVGD